MLELLEAFASSLIVPSVAFGLLIGAVIGALICWFVFGEMSYIVIAVSAFIAGLLNSYIFKHLSRR